MHKVSFHGAVGSNRRRRFLFRIVIDDEPQPRPFSLSTSIADGAPSRDPFRQAHDAPDRYGDGP
jgi:hypothetical protein